MKSLGMGTRLSGYQSGAPRHARLTPAQHKRVMSQRCRLAAGASGFDAESFNIPAAPLLIPSGDWTEVEGGVCAPSGFTASGMYAGIRASGVKGDLSLVYCADGATAAGAFTRNVMCAAPVLLCKEVLSKNTEIKAVLTNAGQANAATGTLGMQDSRESADVLAGQLGCKADEVLVMSTGVIGRRIKMDALKGGLPALIERLGPATSDAHRSAVSITTTDLVSKSCALVFKLDEGTTVTLGGMCKGSGMIHPNMGTMLGLLTCDVAVDATVWQDMLRRAVDRSFNAITVDGDSSTNDTVIALASGTAANEKITDASSPASLKLEAALTAVLQGMAKSIAWDGEGATCLLEVTCTGAQSEADARLVAKSVAASSLTKAAMFGNDPNWGRIACAAGYSGAEFVQEDLGVTLGPYELMKDGQPLEFDEIAASEYLKETSDRHGTVTIGVCIGSSKYSGMAWGCDLSYDYVKINAEYTT